MAIYQQPLLTAGSLVRVQQGEPKKALAFASAFFNEINTCGICEMPCGREIRLRRVKSLRRWGLYFISLDAKRQISQFAEQIISPWAKRTISLFVKIKCFEYWTQSVSRGAGLRREVLLSLPGKSIRRVFFSYIRLSASYIAAQW